MMVERPVVRQLITSLIILIVCAGLFVGLTRMKNAPEKEKKRFNPPVVEILPLKPEAVTLTIQSQGMVKPVIETRLVAEISGMVKTVSDVFASGSVFKKGEVLATIDDRDYRVILKQADAGLAASEAKLAEEIAKAEAEKKNWLRSGKKLKDAPDLLLRKPYVAEAKANVKAAESQRDKARRDLDKTIITAPYDGMVRQRIINVGQFLSPGSEVGTVFSIDFAEVRLPIKSSDLQFLDLPSVGHNKTPAIKVLLEQRAGRKLLSWSAAVTRVEGVVDDSSRMHFVVAEVADPYGLIMSREAPLKAGSFVYAKLQGKTLDNLFRLPRSALYGSGQVIIVEQANIGFDVLRFRDVEVVYSDESDVFVVGALSAGDKVCLTPLSNPVEGMQVRSGQNANAMTDNNDAIHLSQD